MGKCSICNEDVLFGIKIADGTVCRKCASLFPRGIRIKTLDRISAGYIHTYEMECRHNFSHTASYGGMSIDEHGGYFRLGKDVFSISSLKSVDFSCGTPHAGQGNTVSCDVWFEFLLNDMPLKRKVKIKSGARCHVLKIADGKISFEYPGDYGMFREMFRQMLENNADRFHALAGVSSAVEVFRAKSLFIVGDTFTADELTDRRTRLISAFKGTADEEHDRFFIDRAYRVLLGELADTEEKINSKN